MNYKEFQQDIIDKNGDLFAAQLEQFFTKAVDFAQNEKYDEALIVGNDALVLAKYSNAGYAILYLLGMLCQVYLDSDKPEIADKYFRYGMNMIDENKNENADTYHNDINSFLDLKIIIDDELKKKNGL
ncbi:MAG: hypothetical protein WCQ95_05465 [Bacteroidota bacterium]